MELSKRIQNLLIAYNMSEADLWRKTGIAKGYINQLTNGKNSNPSLKHLMRLSNAFNLTISEFVGEEKTSLNMEEITFINRYRALTTEEQKKINDYIDVCKPSLKKEISKKETTA